MRRVALVVVGAVVLVGLVGPLLQYGSITKVVDIPYAPSSVDYWLGTDHFGTDVLARVLAGGWRILLLSTVTVVAVYVVGGLAGMLAAQRRGWVGGAVLRCCDVLTGLPALVLLTVVVASTGRGVVGVAVATAVVLLPDLIRVVRASTISVLEHDYVEAAVLAGQSTRSILVREVAPNLRSIVVADLGLRWVAAVYTIATASFLGFGVQAPAADWGLMVYENRDGLALQPLAVMVPAGLLVLLLVSVNLLVDQSTPPVRPQQVARRNDAAPRDAVLSAIDLRVEDSAGRSVVAGVDLAIQPGQIVAMVGASGSGKTTTALALMGHVRPGLHLTSGSVHLDGQPLFGADGRTIRRLRASAIAYVPQDPRTALPATMRIRALLDEMLRAREVAAELRTPMMRAALATVGVPDTDEFLARYPRELSGGQRQRICLAAAVAHRPRVLVMDEPTSALDPPAAAALMADVARLRDEYGLAVLLVSHDRRAVARVADRVVVMDRGVITAEGTAGELLASDRDVSVHERSASSGPVVLRVEGLGVDLPGTAGVLTDVELAVRAGSTLTVLGRSGCGKTTLLRALTGLTEPTAGRVIVEDEELAATVRRRSLKQRRRLQLVTQNPFDSLNPRHRVGRILAGPLARRAVPTHRIPLEINALLADVGLERDHATRYPEALSGGQRQRVAVARSLAAAPAVLLCDEATSVLDVDVGRQLLDLLLSLQDEHGLGLVVVTHDLDVPAYLGGEVAVLKDGRFIEAGPVTEVLRNPQHEHTRELVAPWSGIALGANE